MFRIDSPGNVNNKFTQGDPLATPPIPPTVISDEWLNAIQEEISHVIESAGGNLNKADSTQLWTAILNYINSKSAIIPTPDTLIKRDADGKAQVADPVDNKDIVNLETLNKVGYSGPVPGTLMRRDYNGRAQVTDPAADTDIVNLQYLNTHSVFEPTAGTIMKRDANGRAQVADPSVNLDIVNLEYLNQSISGFSAAYANDTGNQFVSVTLAAALQTVNLTFTLLKPINGFLHIYAGDFGAGSLTLNIMSKYRGTYVTIYSCVYTSSGTTGTYDKYLDGLMLNPGLYQLQLSSNNAKIVGSGHLVATGYANTNGNLKI